LDALSYRKQHLHHSTGHGCFEAPIRTKITPFKQRFGEGCSLRCLSGEIDALALKAGLAWTCRVIENYSVACAMDGVVNEEIATRGGANVVRNAIDQDLSWGARLDTDFMVMFANCDLKSLVTLHGPRVLQVKADVYGA